MLVTTEVLGDDLPPSKFLQTEGHHPPFNDYLTIVFV